jgi:hypothetical protein
VNQKRDLQRQVLEHLKKHGPCHYGGLCVLFDVHRTAEIGPALVNLLQWKHIERDKDNMVTMTAAGLQWLEAQPIPPSTADPT